MHELLYPCLGRLGRTTANALSLTTCQLMPMDRAVDALGQGEGPIWGLSNGCDK